MIKVFIFALFLGPEGETLAYDHMPVTEMPSVEACESTKERVSLIMEKSSPYPYYIECFQGSAMELSLRIPEVIENLPEFVTAPGEDA